MTAYEKGKKQGERYVRSIVQVGANGFDFFMYLSVERAARAYKTFAKQDEFSQGWMAAWPEQVEYEFDNVS